MPLICYLTPWLTRILSSPSAKLHQDRRTCLPPTAHLLISLFSTTRTRRTLVPAAIGKKHLASRSSSCGCPSIQILIPCCRLYPPESYLVSSSRHVSYRGRSGCGPDTPFTFPKTPVTLPLQASSLSPYRQPKELHASDGCRRFLNV